MLEYGAWGWTRATLIENCETTTATPEGLPTALVAACKARLAELDSSFEGWLGEQVGDADPTAAWDS